MCLKSVAIRNQELLWILQKMWLQPSTQNGFEEFVTNDLQTAIHRCCYHDFKYFKRLWYDWAHDKFKRNWFNFVTMAIVMATASQCCGGGGWIWKQLQMCNEPVVTAMCRASSNNLKKTTIKWQGKNLESNINWLCLVAWSWWMQQISKTTEEHNQKQGQSTGWLCIVHWPHHREKQNDDKRESLKNL